MTAKEERLPGENSKERSQRKVCGCGHWSSQHDLDDLLCKVARCRCTGYSPIAGQKVRP